MICCVSLGNAPMQHAKGTCGMGTVKLILLAVVQPRSKELVIRRCFIALGVALALLLTLAGMVWASEPVQEGRPGRPIIVRWSTG